MKTSELTQYSVLLITIFLLCACSGFEAARTPATASLIGGKLEDKYDPQSNTQSGDPTANEDSGDDVIPTPNPNPSPNPSPTPPEYPVCAEILKKKKFYLEGKVWKKPIKKPCGAGGVGYIEIIVIIDPIKVCVQAPENLEYTIDKSLEKIASVDESATPKQTFPVPEGLTTETKKKFCSPSQRCPLDVFSSNEALGRLAWIAKCENEVPAFKEFMNVMREIENCDVTNTHNGKFCLFNSEGSSIKALYFPEVLINGQPTAPAPAIEYDGTLKGVDQLKNPSLQALVASYSCPIPGSVAPIDSICSAGCYRGDQRILLSKSGKYQDILTAHRAQAKTIAVLTQDSSVEHIKLTNAPVGRFVATKEDASEVLLHIETQLGIKLVVTTNHPLLDAGGVMREASRLKVGDQLFRIDGRADAIKSIVKQNFLGKVYNVSPVSPAPEDNLIVAEGVISGSHNFQTELHSHINRVVLRSHLSRGY